MGDDEPVVVESGRVVGGQSPAGVGEEIARVMSGFEVLTDNTGGMVMKELLHVASHRVGGIGGSVQDANFAAIERY